MDDAHAGPGSERLGWGLVATQFGLLGVIGLDVLRARRLGGMLGLLGIALIAAGSTFNQVTGTGANTDNFGNIVGPVTPEKVTLTGGSVTIVAAGEDRACFAAAL